MADIIFTIDTIDRVTSQRYTNVCSPPHYRRLGPDHIESVIVYATPLYFLPPQDSSHCRQPSSFAQMEARRL